MAFAIFYNDEDCPFIERVYTDRNKLVISSADKNLALQFWNGGLKDWKTAPIAQSPYEQFIPTNTARRIVISYGTLQQFRDLLYRIALDNPDIRYIRALADDMGRNCGGVEPWPVV